MRGLFVLGVILASVDWFSLSGNAQSEDAPDHGSSVATTAVPSTAFGVAAFHQSVEPVLKQYCYDCHGNGTKNGHLAFDELNDEQIINPTLWLKVLKNLRGHHAAQRRGATIRRAAAEY